MLIKENISFWLSIISIFTAVYTAYRNIWISRAQIKVIQTDKAARSYFIKSFDGCYRSYSPPIKPEESYEPNIVSVLLIEVIITNKSSLPISILEFSTKDFCANPFTSYSYTKDFFTITTPQGVTKLGTPDSPLKFIQPEFTLQPYTSERGYIMFWSGREENFITPQKITLETITSRKIFKAKINIPDHIESIKKMVLYGTDENDRPTKVYY
ncbi:hypothetical protein [Enterococcus faecium]|uniref:hypothetical protein n=1 Tax=Enterococcus faecium TaxID=1352 RepID=UPI002DB69781|nr:hypothetical protein [Enterococcus faecium]MEB6013812.1 hypothetical protein [Enterococcus faecium]